MEEGVKADEAEVGFGVRVHTVPFGPSSKGPWKLQILCFMNIFMGFFFFFFYCGSWDQTWSLVYGRQALSH